MLNPFYSCCCFLNEKKVYKKVLLPLVNPLNDSLPAMTNDLTSSRRFDAVNDFRHGLVDLSVCIFNYFQPSNVFFVRHKSSSISAGSKTTLVSFFLGIWTFLTMW
jgi:hypothetical protein